MDVDFARALIRCLDEIPRGRVATCGAIARALGDGRAARAVATWLTEHPTTAGGHRVVRADGRPILVGAKKFLASEGQQLASGRVNASRIVHAVREVEFFGPLREEQRRLASAVIERDEPERMDIVAGVDVAYRYDEMCAAAASVAVKGLRPVELAVVRGRVEFPYVPTYLAYREFPAIEAAVRRLATRPDVLMIDGHGQLHPALFGVACYAGIKLGMRAIGIAKHPLAGRMRSPRKRDAGAFPIEIDGVARGFAWTPPGRARPIYVSVGHRISLDGALALVRTTTRHAYPEPLRIADRVSREMKGNEKREKGAAQ